MTEPAFTIAPDTYDRIKDEIADIYREKYHPGYPGGVTIPFHAISDRSGTMLEEVRAADTLLRQEGLVAPIPKGLPDDDFLVITESCWAKWESRDDT